MVRDLGPAFELDRRGVRFIFRGVGVDIRESELIMRNVR